MSLEAALQETTRAIHALIAAMGQQAAPAHAAAAVAIEKAAKVTPPNPVASVAEPVATAPAVTTVESPSSVTYADVSAAVMAKMKTDKPAVMAAAAKFGVKNAKELKQSQWADFIKEVA